jgi:hypothetical protein
MRPRCVTACPVSLYLFTFIQAAVGAPPSAPCDGVKIPQAISALLEKSFPHWRVEKPSDSDASYQEIWTKKFPADYPGFVAGYFQKPDSMAYAVLLVPADQTKKGYRLVVFAEAAKGSWHPFLLDKDDRYTPTSVVIRRAPPGDYEEADSNKKVHSRTDGIVNEQIEVGDLVYYWTGTRFRSIATSV